MLEEMKLVAGLIIIIFTVLGIVTAGKWFIKSFNSYIDDRCSVASSIAIGSAFRAHEMSYHYDEYSKRKEFYKKHGFMTNGGE